MNKLIHGSRYDNNIYIYILRNKNGGIFFFFGDFGLRSPVVRQKIDVLPKGLLPGTSVVANIRNYVCMNTPCHGM